MKTSTQTPKVKLADLPESPNKAIAGDSGTSQVSGVTPESPDDPETDDDDDEFEDSDEFDDSNEFDDDLDEGTDVEDGEGEDDEDDGEADLGGESKAEVTASSVGTSLDPSSSADDSAGFRARIWNAELKIREKESEVDDLKEQLKEAKASLESAITRLRKISQEAEEAAKNDANRPLLAGQDDTGGKTSDAMADPAAANESVLNGWENQPIDLLVDRACKSLKGLGQKKVDAFLEKFKTFMDFENVRTAASKDGAPLHNYMPKGIGETMTADLENLYLDIVSKPFVAPEIPCPFRLRADELLAVPDLDSEFDRDIWNQGWDAWEADVPLAACPFGEDDKFTRDEWLRGWLSCDQAPEGEATEVQDGEADTEPAESIDDALAEL